jgi:hypothetical protein
LRAHVSAAVDDHLERSERYAKWMTVREMLTTLHSLPRDAELLAFEAG